MKKFKLINIIMVLAVFALSFFIGNTIAGMRGNEDEPTKIQASKDEETGLPVDRLNVLLLGIDARKGEEEARTDSMILVSIDKETNKIAMLSIPRDTLVDIPGHGKDKINSANLYGGPELAVDTVEDLLGVNIPYYVKTNFEGFKDIVDTLGGVTIDVEKRMYHNDGKYTINLKKGKQRLDGAKALQYVRYRHDALGDITRTARQQKFLAALADEILQAKTIVKLPKLIPQIFDVVDTNFGVKDVFLLTKVASSMKADNIVAQTLPGTFYNYKGISYWKANEEKTKVVLEDMFRGTTTAAVVDRPIEVPKEEKPKPQQRTKPEPPKEQVQAPVDVEIGESGDGTEKETGDGSWVEPGANTGLPGTGTGGQTPNPTTPGQPNGTGTVPPATEGKNPGGGVVAPGPTEGSTSPTSGGNTGSGTTQPPVDGTSAGTSTVKSSKADQQTKTVTEPVYSPTGNV